MREDKVAKTRVLGTGMVFRRDRASRDEERCWYVQTGRGGLYARFRVLQWRYAFGFGWVMFIEAHKIASDHEERC